MKVLQSEERFENVEIEGRVHRFYASPDLKVLGQVAELTKGSGGTKGDGTSKNGPQP